MYLSHYANSLDNNTFRKFLTTHATKIYSNLQIAAKITSFIRLAAKKETSTDSLRQGKQKYLGSNACMTRSILPVENCRIDIGSAMYIWTLPKSSDKILRAFSNPYNNAPVQTFCCQELQPIAQLVAKHVIVVSRHSHYNTTETNKSRHVWQIVWLKY